MHSEVVASYQSIANTVDHQRIAALDTLLSES
jgi:hypothetical protein